MIKLIKERGEIEITSEVLSLIAGHTATNCFGVVGMAKKSKAEGIVSLLKKDSLDKGVRVSASENLLIIDLHIIVTYGINIKAITESIINKVKYNVEQMTGFGVKTVNIYVDGMRN
jgi:uncharacterized alkaline shock family protein YloU